MWKVREAGSLRIAIGLTSGEHFRDGQKVDDNLTDTVNGVVVTEKQRFAISHLWGDAMVGRRVVAHTLISLIALIRICPKFEEVDYS